jgi:hypothetical protein
MASDVVAEYAQRVDIHACSRAFLGAVRSFHQKDLGDSFYGALVQWTGIDEDRLKVLLSSRNVTARQPDLCGYEITALMATVEEFDLRRMFGVPEALDEDAVVHAEFLKFYQGADKEKAAAKPLGLKRQMLYQHVYELCLQRYPVAPETPA